MVGKCIHLIIQGSLFRWSSCVDSTYSAPRALGRASCKRPVGMISHRTAPCRVERSHASHAHPGMLIRPDEKRWSVLLVSGQSWRARFGQTGMARLLAARALRQKRLFLARRSHCHHCAWTPGTVPRDVELLNVGSRCTYIQSFVEDGDDQ